MGQQPDAFPELPRSGQRPTLREMQAGRPAGERNEARDGHVRRSPGSPEAVTGGGDAERRDVFPGDMAFGRADRPPAGQEGEVPDPERGDRVEGETLLQVVGPGGPMALT